MSSGFLTLPDGRCFSRKEWAHDTVLYAIADQLAREPLGQELQKWILEQLPGPDDNAYIMCGLWIRNSDGENIRRSIDLRNMTVENQRLFCKAAKQAILVDYSENWIRQCFKGETDENFFKCLMKDWVEDNWLKKCLKDLADMIDRCERGESPLSKSDCGIVMPLEDEKIGPGWDSIS